jgi:uncharacterized protein YggT (Ycf19 family)
MKHTTHPRYIQPVTGQYRPIDYPHVDQEIVQYVTRFITLAFNTINVLIILRFLLDLLNASPSNPFTRLIFATSEPFLSVFQGLTRSPFFRDITAELTALFAITVYSLLGWSVNRLLHILFTR